MRYLTSVADRVDRRRGDGRSAVVPGHGRRTCGGREGRRGIGVRRPSPRACARRRRRRRRAPPAAAAPRPAGAPARDTWYAKPVKVFDNLYFVGQTEYSAWAVTTSDGIIIIDPIFDYSVEEEVVNGLKALGFDPNNIKYVLISHAHSDHVGGASYLQDRFNAKVIMSEADWTLLEGTRASWRKPRKELVATDGQKLTLGGTTLTLHITPGHTLGTISTLIPVLRRRDAARGGVLGRHRVQLGRPIAPPTSRRSAPTVSGSTTTSSRRSASGRSRRTPAPT